MESEKKDKYHDLARELKKKTMGHKIDDDTNYNGSLGTVTKGLVQRLVDLKIRGQRETI